MKTLLNKCKVAILTLTLAVSAYAGQIQFPGIASGGGSNSTPDTASTTGTTSTTTDITTTVILAATSLIS